MRKLILIAAVSLVSATAYAGPTRSLSLASSEPSPAADQPNATQKTDSPPAAIERSKLAVPQETRTPAVADKSAEPAKPKVKHVSTEARVIYELHRHGIYW
jgi:hypothetical protein